MFGTETPDQTIIARDAIEIAQPIKFIMKSDVLPQLVAQGFPPLNFRIGVEMGEVSISRIGLHNMNFLTAVGSPANRASKLEALANKNGITIGENLARNLHPYLHQFLALGDDTTWDWYYDDKVTPYNYYHYTYEWYEPSEWIKDYFKFVKVYKGYE